MKQFAETKAAKTIELIDRLMGLSGVSAQTKLLIIRWSLRHRMSHLIRSVDWGLLERSMQDLHDRVVSAVLELAGISQPSEQIVRQLELPISSGGLGLTRMDSLAANAGRLAAAALTQSAFSEGRPSLQPFEGASAARFAPLLEELRAAQPELWPDSLRIAPRGLLAAGISKAWQEHACARRKQCFEELLSALEQTPRGNKEVARLRSCSAPEAGAWADALPITPHLRMDDLDVRLTLKHMLGHCTFLADAPAFPCECGAQVSAAMHDHAMTCKTIARDKTLRHDAITISVRRSVTRAGLASTLEPKVYSIGGGAANPDDERPQARGDILIVTDEGRKVVDVSVTHAPAESYAQAAARSNGAAAAVREREKVRQYQRQGDQGFTFHPFVVESHGRLGKQAWELVNALATLAAERGSVSKRAFKRGLLQEVSVALQCGNTRVYAHGNACQARARGLGRRFCHGLRRPTANLRLG